MNLESVRGNEAWEQFIRFADAAKTRNAGLNIPLPPNRSVGNAERYRNMNQNSAMNSAASLKKNFYAHENIPNQEKKQILGTKFDAYA
jgi:hypothetical protein